MKTKLLTTLFLAACVAHGAPRLVNLSTLTAIPENRVLIVGFIVSGTQPRPMLLRAIGPSLAAFGIADAITDPRIELAGQFYDDWSAAGAPLAVAASARVGAFPIANESLDSVALLNVQPGAVTPFIRNLTPRNGRILIELYDAGAGSDNDSTLANISVRTTVSTDVNILTLGFVLAGEGDRGVLMRVMGPALRGFGLSGFLEDPDFVVHRDGTQIYYNDDFSAQGNGEDLAAVSDKVGAFPFIRDPKLDTGKDAAAFLRLPPGSYTLTVNPKAPPREARTGEVLAEIYLVP